MSRITIGSVSGNQNTIGDFNTVGGSKTGLSTHSHRNELGIENLPIIELTSSQQLWLRESWRLLLENGAPPSYKTIKINTLAAVDANFNPHSIDQRLIKEQSTQITLLGVLLTHSDPKILDNIDLLVSRITRNLIEDPTKDSFLLDEIASYVELSTPYARIIFTLATPYGSFWSSAQSITQTNSSFGYIQFSVGEPQSFDFYINYKGIRACINDYYIRQEQYAKEYPKSVTGTTFVPINQPESFIDITRLEQLKKLPSTKFDFTKLIRLCEEVNICYSRECFFATAALTRSIIDHVAPAFGVKSFTEVAANYAGSRSFKASMEHLERSLRKIADGILHTQIRAKEALPNKTQVNFSHDLDVLLEELVRINK